MESEDLDRLIRENRWDEACSLVDQLGEARVADAVPLLIHHLLTTDDVRLRYRIALALSDIRNPQAVDPLMTVIKDPRTEGYRGTLVYALTI